jgi:UDP-galactopyranose mutase
MNEFLVVGSGLTGSVIANYLARAGQNVRVFESRDAIGGNVVDGEIAGYSYHKYGPHFFHTNSEKIWKYVNQFGEWRNYEHRVKAELDGLFIPIPFNRTALEIFYPDKSELLVKLMSEEFPSKSGNITIHKLMKSKHEQLRELAQFIYLNIFKGYTEKQWGTYSGGISESVTSRVPVRANYDDRYFTDTFQGLPIAGYSQVVHNILDDPKIKVELNSKFELRKTRNSQQKVIFTGPVDELFSYEFGPLPYRSLRHEYRVIKNYRTTMPAMQTNYSKRYEFTRIMDYSHLYESQNGGIISLEFPQNYEPSQNLPFYPVPGEESRTLYKQYESLAKDFGILLAGRLGNYQYLNMDQAIAGALQLAEEILN